MVLPGPPVWCCLVRQYGVAWSASMVLPGPPVWCCLVRQYGVAWSASMVLPGPPVWCCLVRQPLMFIWAVSWNMTALRLIGSVSRLGALLGIRDVSSDHYWFLRFLSTGLVFLRDHLLSCSFSVSFRNAVASADWFQRLCTVRSVLLFGQLKSGVGAGFTQFALVRYIYISSTVATVVAVENIGIAWS